MHELSLAEALVEQVNNILAEQQAARVHSITLIMGELSGVERDAFEFAFPVAVENTCLEGATLHIQERKAVVKCHDCGRESTPDIPFIQCRHCGSRNVDIVSGREFAIQTMEIE